MGSQLEEGKKAGISIMVCVCVTFDHKDDIVGLRPQSLACLRQNIQSLSQTCPMISSHVPGVT